MPVLTETGQSFFINFANRLSKAGERLNTIMGLPLLHITLCLKAKYENEHLTPALSPSLRRLRDAEREKRSQRHSESYPLPLWPQPGMVSICISEPDGE